MIPKRAAHPGGAFPFPTGRESLPPIPSVGANAHIGPLPIPPQAAGAASAAPRRPRHLRQGRIRRGEAVCPPVRRRETLISEIRLPTGLGMILESMKNKTIVLFL